MIGWTMVGKSAATVSRGKESLDHRMVRAIPSSRPNSGARERLGTELGLLAEPRPLPSAKSQNLHGHPFRGKRVLMLPSRSFRESQVINGSGSQTIRANQQNQPWPCEILELRMGNMVT